MKSNLDMTKPPREDALFGGDMATPEFAMRIRLWQWDFTADYRNFGVVLMAGRDVFALRLGFWAITAVRR